MSDSGKMKDLVFIIVIALAVIFIFQKMLGNEFVYDDWGVIQKNIPIRTTVSPAYYFTHPMSVLHFSDSANADTYRPLEYVWFALTYKFFGLDPLFFHLVSLVVHALNAALLFILLNLIFKSRVLAGFSALFFGIHPVTTETVAWATQQGGVWSMFFLLITLILAFGFKKEDWSAAYARLFYLFLFSALSVFFKEHAVILPAFFVLIAFFLAPSGMRARASRVSESWREIIAVSLPALTALALRYMYLENFAQGGVWGGSRYNMALTMLTAFKYYIRLLFWPDPLSINYDLFPFGKSILDINVLGSAIFIASIILFGFALYSRAKIFSLGVFMFFTALIPISNVIFPMKQILNERFLYFALPGFLIAVFGLFIYFRDLWLEKFTFRFVKTTDMFFLSIAICYLAIFSYLTLLRLDDWKSDLALWRSELSVSGDTRRTNSAYAIALEREGKNEEALKYYKSALFVTTGPDKRQILFKVVAVERLAQALIRMGKEEEAIIFLTQAIDEFPQNGNLRFALGSAHFKNGEYEDAIKIFKSLIGKTAPQNGEKNPQNAIRIYNILSMALNGAAQNEIRREIDKMPSEPERRAMPNIIEAKKRMLRKDWPKALEALNKVVEDKALTFLEPYLWRAEALERLGRFDEAIDDYDLVSIFYPESIEAAQGLKRLTVD